MSTSLFDPRRYFNRDIHVLGRGMSDWSNGDLLVAASLWVWMIDSKNDCARSILPPLDQPSFLFFLPEIRV